MIVGLISHIFSRFFLWNFLVILLFSLIAGHLVVTHGRDYEFWVLVKRQGYRLSVLYSGSIALVLLLCIYGISFRLYGRYGGQGLTRPWLLAQLGYGGLGVVGIELLAATLLFWSQGLWIGDTAYFDKLFNPIVLSIFFCNVCYLLFFSNRTVGVTVRYKLLDNTVREPLVEVSEKTLPAIIYMEKGKIFCVDFDGVRTDWHLPTLKKSWKELGLQDYFRGDRYWIVHRALIVDMSVLPGKRLIITCHLARDFTLEVSRRNVANFKRWKEGNLEEIKI